MQAKFYGSLGNISSSSTFYLWGQLHISKALELATLHTVSGSLPNFLTTKSKRLGFFSLEPNSTLQLCSGKFCMGYSQDKSWCGLEIAGTHYPTGACDSTYMKIA